MKSKSSLLNISNKVHLIISNILIFCIDSIRPLLGNVGMVCIYPVSCSDYAKFMLQNKSLLISIPLITLRVLSCNPITAIFLKIKNRFFSK
ncbi:TPA: membrane protein insertion efficiency factor YidD [Candidatus Dependentiae bacterium]|nr:membrane protein insertion efficiency factor YidD [Candidatus Dependentiae bacterium]HBZ73136.1 membrane protein insertion efficiency factor YidD [Candidatus Dependentiae bacterium]